MGVGGVLVQPVPPGYTDPHNWTGPDPVPTWAPSDGGLLAAVCDPYLVRDTQLLTAGSVYMVRVDVTKQITVTNICFNVSTVGAGASTGSFAGLYTGGLTPALIAQTADIGTQLVTAAVFIAAPLTTPQVIGAGQYYIGIVENLATTQVTLSKTAAVGPMVNLGQTSLRGALGGTALSALPAAPTLVAAGLQALWVGLS